MNDGGTWFNVMMGKKKVLPPALSLPATNNLLGVLGLVPVVSLPAPALPATKNLLGVLGLMVGPVPPDGNCALHCAVVILKEADALKHANTTHDSLRAEMCTVLLLKSDIYHPYHVGNKASYL
jgi:hypothetical protein